MSSPSTATRTPAGTPDRGGATHPAGFLSRLTTGTGAFDVLGRRRFYYLISTVLVVASLLFIFIRGFNLGIDFAGGTKVLLQPGSGQSIDAAKTQAEEVFTQATGVEVESVQQVGTGAGAQVQISSASLTEDKVAAARNALASTFKLSPDQVSATNVSNTWGEEVSYRAVIAVLVFLVLVGAFIWIRYERRLAIGAVVSVVHDLIVTAGVYAAVGFEVAPATIIGLLTILGFSLYDTVVVYDKVQENAKGLTSLTRRTYPEAANLAVNQTLMRSINTSLIALLPVAGLLVAGVAILGSGTLKDLALVLLVGMLIGAYSSVFVAVPVAVDLKLRQGTIRTHTAKVVAKRKSEGVTVDATGEPLGLARSTAGPLVRSSVAAAAPATAGTSTAGRSTTPRPGVKPVRPTTKQARPATATARPAGAGAGPSYADSAIRIARAAPEAEVATAADLAEPEIAAVVASGSGVARSARTSTPVPGARPAGRGSRPAGKKAR